MARNLDPKCKQCRRVGEKLFLKGEKCFTPKCPIVRRNYPPGQHGQSGSSRLSGYALQLREKQKAKKMYGLLERQFRNYYEQAVKRAGNSSDTFFRLLELRLDNVVFRLGLARSRDHARQLVNHGHAKVNDRRVDIASAHVRVGDKIEIKPASRDRASFEELSKLTPATSVPHWLNREEGKLMGQVSESPNPEDFPSGIQMPLIIEYYSR